MATQPTFAQKMVAKLEALLLKNVGVDTVNTDGVMVKYVDLEAQYRKWQSRVATEAGRRPRAAKIRLDRF